MSDSATAPGSLRSLIRLIVPHRAVWFGATAALIAAGLVKLTIPQVLKMAIDDALVAEDIDALQRILLIALGVFVLLSSLSFLRGVLVSWLGQRIVADLRGRTFAHLLRQPPGFFHVRKSGALLSRLTSDIGTLRYAVGAELSILLRSTVTVVGGLLILGVTSIELTALIAIFVPPGIFSAQWAGRRIRKRAREAQDEVAQANARLKESVVGIETVQVFKAEPREHARYLARIMDAFERGFRAGVLHAGLWSSIQLFGHTTIALILWYGGKKVISDEMSPGDLTAFIAYTMMVTGALGSMSSVWGNLQRALGASERVFSLLAEEPGILDGPESPETIDGRITFNEVSFAYDGRPETDVLSGFNLTIEPGEFVALVGRSGAGKSTLSALIQRFHDPQHGQISLDGHALPDLTLSALRGSIATVRQEPVLFADTLRENIRYGLPDADDVAVGAAAKAANLDELITQLPEGLDTLVGERGVKLSGGQRQRVSIARALLSDPRILILDEATCHLDAASELAVHSALSRLMVGRTTLVIAHRLSTIRKADRIVVMSEGAVVDSGTHDQLEARCEVYRDLLQATKDVDGHALRVANAENTRIG
ncbi:MAG: ABC transporter ATP-binding protein [Myxococcota bacterium]